MTVAAYTAQAIARGGVLPARRVTGRDVPVATVVVLVAGVVAAVVVAPSAGYDASWHLAWGKELVEGQRPDGAVPGAPTAHPLVLLVSTLLAPLGPDRATAALTLLVGVALGAIALAVRSVAASLGMPKALALLAGVLAASSPELIRSASILGSDAFVLALTATAAAALLDGRHRAAVVWLSAATLLRPEAWLLLVVVVAARDRRASAALIAGPIAWALTGWFVAGDPAYALTGTRALADTLDRPTGVGAAAVRFGPDLLGAVGPLTALAGLVVGAIVLQRGRDRRAVLALPIALGALAWLAFGLAGLPLVQRYLLVPGTALVILACAAPAVLVPGRRLGIALLAAVALVDGGLRVATLVEARSDAAHAGAEAHAVRALRLDGCDRVGVTQARLIPDVIALGPHASLGPGAVTIAPIVKTVRSAVLTTRAPNATPTTTAGPYARYGTC